MSVTDSDSADDTTHVVCHRCEYEWDTASQMMKVTCPSCGYKTTRESPDETNDSS